MVFCCFGCVSKKVSGCWFLAIYRGSSSSQNWTKSKLDKNWNSSKISEGTLRPPGNLLLRLILRHFRHEIRWCFAVSAVFRKRCVAAGFFLFIRRSNSNQNWRKSKLRQNWISIVGFQKGRFGLRGTCYCDCFCVIFGTKLGSVLLFWLCFKKGVWLLLSCSFIEAAAAVKIGDQNWTKLDF